MNEKRQLGNLPLEGGGDSWWKKKKFSILHLFVTVLSALVAGAIIGAMCFYLSFKDKYDSYKNWEKNHAKQTAFRGISLLLAFLFVLMIPLDSHSVVLTPQIAAQLAKQREESNRRLLANIANNAEFDSAVANSVVSKLIIDTTNALARAEIEKAKKAWENGQYSTLVMCVVAVVVIVVGGYAIYVIWKMCKKLPPLPSADGGTNITKNAMIKLSPSATQDVKAAWFTIDSFDQRTNTFIGDRTAVFTYYAGETATNSTFTINSSSVVTEGWGQSDVETFAKSYGLQPTYVVGQASYSDNGVPVPSLSEINYQGGILTVTNKPGPTKSFVLWGTPDGTHWMPLFKTRVSVGTTNLIYMNGVPNPDTFFRLVPDP